MSCLSNSTRERAERTLEVLRGAVSEFKKVCYANSLGTESVVLTDLIWRFVPDIEMFSIDPGRPFPETFELIERLQIRYGRTLRIYYPETSEVEDWVSKNGINGFRDSLNRRQGCCSVRKIEPFRRAISGHAAWITGIRRGQTAGRALAAPLIWDATYGLHKLSPLLDWTEDEVWEYIRKQRLPYNSLHDSGFPSIGCAPCSRAVQPGDDPRSGRRWWERSESRECGLHPRQPRLLSEAR